MKYIRTATEDDKHEIFIFPRSVNHDCMMEMIERIKDQTHGQWKRIRREAVSAGFVDSQGNCHGMSESLGIESDPSDTALMNSRESFQNHY